MTQIIRNPQPSFASGEVSEYIHGRNDFRRHDTGLARGEGVCVLPTGGLTRRPATKHIGEALTGSVLVPHEASVSATRVIELGSLQARFISNGAFVMDGGTPYTLTTGYQGSDLPDLRWWPSGDVMYFTSPTAGLRQFRNFSATNWTDSAIELSRGPFLDRNSDDTHKISVSAITGTGITLTASGGYTFASDLVGALFQFNETELDHIKEWVSGASSALNVKVRHDGRVYINSGAAGSNGANPPTHGFGAVAPNQSTGVVWTYVRGSFGVVKITAVAGDGLTATADVVLEVPPEYLPATNADGTSGWAEGAFSAARGYPDDIVIHKERLTLAKGLRVYLGTTSDYFNFEVTDFPDSPFSELIGQNTGRANDVVWMLPGKVLAIGTVGEEHALFQSDLKSGLSSDNKRLDLTTTEGSINHRAIAVGSGEILFAADGGRAIYNQIFDFQIDDFTADDKSVASAHLLAPGIKKIVWQRKPYRIAWVLLTDGQLRMLTYDRGKNLLGFARAGLNGVVEDMAVVGRQGENHDDLVLRVRHTLPGGDKVALEVLDKFYDNQVDASDLYSRIYLDGMITGMGGLTSTLTGLDFYAGGELTVVSREHGEMGEYTVNGSGEIDLGAKQVTDWWAGLKPTHHIKLLGTAQQIESGSIEGHLRNVIGLALRVIGGPGVFVGDASDDELLEEIDFENVDFSEDPTVKAKTEIIDVGTDWDHEDQLDIVARGPFAFELLRADRVVEASRGA